MRVSFLILRLFDHDMWICEFESVFRQEGIEALLHIEEDGPVVVRFDPSAYDEGYVGIVERLECDEGFGYSVHSVSNGRELVGGDVEFLIECIYIGIGLQDTRVFVEKCAYGLFAFFGVCAVGDADEPFDASEWSAGVVIDGTIGEGTVWENDDAVIGRKDLSSCDVDLDDLTADALCFDEVTCLKGFEGK